MTQHVNDHLVLISGFSSTGKSASLMNFPRPEGVMYLNCEAGKKLPFNSKFQEYKITDPMDVYNKIAEAEQDPNIHSIIIDTLTFLMDMYESQYVLTSTNTMKAWGEYAQYFKNLMQMYIARSSKNIIVLAHTSKDTEDEDNPQTLVKVKGSLMNTGIESFFSTVISTKRLPLSKLTDYNSDLLNISEDDEDQGYKHVFQVRPTKTTTGERIRSPLRMWDRKETYIDNDVCHVLRRLEEYYN